MNTSNEIEMRRPTAPKRRLLHGLVVMATVLVMAACTPGMGTPGPAPFTEMAVGLASDGRNLVWLGGDEAWQSVSGLTEGTMLVSIDYRPSNGLLYALGSDGQLYTVDGDGWANAVGVPQAYGDMSAGAAIDFNPQVDALRVITTADGRNFVTDVAFGLPAEFTTSAFAAGDEHEGAMPMVAATAYDRNVSPFPDGAETVQYSIDAATNVLAIQGKNMGTLTTVGDLGIDVSSVAGLDVSGASGNAYALLTSDGTQRLYWIDLSDAMLTELDVDATGLIDFAIVPGGMPDSAPRFSESALGLSWDGMSLLWLGETASEPVMITGLNPDTMLLALDHRPSDGQVYALGDDGQLYTLTTAGTATPVGMPQTYGDLSWGVALDVNAQVDAIRVVMTADGRNFVTDPATGSNEEFTASAFLAGDEHEGTMPMVVATAYDLSLSPFPEDSVTTQYSLEAEAGVLAIQGKNAGTLETIATLGRDIGEVAGLDVSGASGNAYALLTVGGVQGFFWVDLETAALQRLAVVVGELRDFTIVPD